MDEMAMLRELGGRLDREPPGTLARQRNRLSAGPVRGRAVWRWRAAVAGGLAVTLAVGFALAQTVRFGSREPSASADAAEVLIKAAATAAKEPAPRPDQFVFVHFKERQDGETREGTDWLSADGRRVGLLRRNPPLGGPPGRKGWGQEWACEEGNHPATDLRHPPSCKATSMYRSDLPTDAGRMLAYLYQQDGGGSKDDAAWEQASDLTGEALPPRSRAALLEAMARIPGATVIKNVTDDAGRPGVGVAYVSGNTAHREREILIFDRSTYAFLGERNVLVKSFNGRPPGTVTFYSVLLRTAYVDRVGQMP
ncbi:CU044_5270 family protein [Actinoallomurus sp. CA-150999]|uniref:CU044_5270 family protein n=1 Tax=Actinoallomurus sp. CA-150999 TaxID=3239887 RepID=UPI003D8E56B2